MPLELHPHIDILRNKAMKNRIDQLFDFLDRYALWMLIIWVTILSILYSALSLLRHIHFQSGGFDLGLYDQAVWQYAHFLWPYNTIKDRFILGDHLTLTLPLLSLLYWLWEDVRILLIFQAVAVATSTIAIYLLARVRKFTPFVAFVVAWTYSLFYGIQYGIFFDFHPVVYGVALFAWFIYFFESKKKIVWIVLLIFALATQENMGLALSSLGCIYFFRKEFRGYALWFIIGGVAISLVASRIVAWFSPVGFQYWPSISLHPLTIAQSFFDSEEKRLVWLYTLSSFSFLSVFSFGAMMAILFDLAQYFISGPEFSRMWSPFMHHRAMLALFVTLGALDTLSFLRKKKIFMVGVAFVLVITTVITQFVLHLPLNKLTKSDYWKKEAWMSDTRTLIDQVPKGFTIATQQNLVPHVSHRETIYLLWPREHDFDDSPCGQRSCWWLDFPRTVDYVVIDLHPNQWVTQLLETNEHVERAIANMEKAGFITLKQSVGFARLYEVHQNVSIR